MLESVRQSPLIAAAGALWTAATRAEFLEAAGAGTLPRAAFQRWLMQDYLFVQGLLAFQAILTAKAPRDAHSPLIGGLVAIDNELSWFEGRAAEAHWSLDAPPHPVCRRYGDFLLAAAYTRPFGVLAAILFGVEATYLAGWSSLPASGPYTECIQRWSSPAFAAYVLALRGVAESHPHPEQQAAFDEVLRHERDFWRMTWEG